MQLGKVVISFGFDHFNDALNGFFAEGTSCAGCQLLIAILAHSIMPARFEDDGSNIDIAKGTIAILSFILTPFLFLFVLFRYLFVSPFDDLIPNLFCYFVSCDPQQNGQKESYQQQSVVSFS